MFVIRGICWNKELAHRNFDKHLKSSSREWRKRPVPESIFGFKRNRAAWSTCSIVRKFVGYVRAF